MNPDKLAGKINQKKERVSKSENLAWAKEVCNDEFFARLAQKINLISEREVAEVKVIFWVKKILNLNQKRGF
jgi:hypothetical protein